MNRKKIELLERQKKGLCELLDKFPNFGRLTDRIQELIREKEDMLVKARISQTHNTHA